MLSCLVKISRTSLTFFLVFFMSLMTSGISAQTNAPDCSAAYPDTQILWPPNHKFNAITIAGVGDANIVIQCIAQDEPLNSNGDGNTEYDGQGIGTATAGLRAERTGGGNGRVYHIDFLASNTSGQCAGSVQVGVPPSKKKAVTDDGPLYISVPDPIQCGGQPINSPPVIDSVPIEQARVGENYHYDVEASDPDDDPITYTLTTAPSGMTIDAATGLIQWLPTAALLGDHPVEIVAADDQGGSTVQAFIVSVLQPVNHDPVITSEPVIQAPVNQLYSYAVTAEDPDNDPLVFSLDSAATGMAITVDGIISWTPTVAQTGDHNISVRVEDDQSGSAIQSYVVTVPVSNANPVISSEPVPQAVLGQPYHYAVIATDPDGDALVYSLTQAPAGMTIDSTTGLISWTSEMGEGGDHLVDILVEDGLGGSANQAYTLSVVVPNNNPVISSIPEDIASVDQAYVYNVIAEDPDGDVLSYELTMAPDGMSIDNVTGILSWTPDNQQVAAHDVVVVVTDGRGGSASQSYTVTVGNTAPTIVSIPVWDTRADSNYQYQLVTQDLENHAISYMLEQGPAGMTVSMVTGLLTWSPQLSDVGFHTVRVKVTDSFGLFDTQEYTVTVLSQSNRGPQITSTPVFNVTEGNTYAYDVDAIDPDNDVLSYTLQQAPAGISISIITGAIGWNPDIPAQLGSHAVTVRVQDIFGAYTTQNYLVTVIGLPNQAPQIISTAIETAEVDQLYSYDVDAIDADNDLLTYSLLDAPGSLSINPQTGLISGIIDQAGSVSVTVNVTDQRDSDQQTYTLVITDPLDNRAPAFITTPVTVVDEQIFYAYDADATDPDGDSLAYSAIQVPAGFTINPASGVISWLADVQYSQSVDALNSNCVLPSPVDGVFEPSLLWEWSASNTFPNNVHVMGTPMVAQTTDDNLDGFIDQKDTPDIIFVGYESQQTNGTGILRIISGDNGQDIVAATGIEQRLSNWSSVAVGDIDGDGLIEIVGLAYPSGVIVFEHDGTTKWINQDPAVVPGWSDGAPAIVDLDGDGTVEIIYGKAVIDHLGQTEWIGAGNFIGNRAGDARQRAVSVAGELGLTPGLEVIAGPSVYSADGTLLWQRNDLVDGLVAIADLTQNGVADIVGVFNGEVYAFDNQGNTLWGPVAHPGGGWGGPPTVADMDGDGLPEIGISADTQYTVFNHDGSILWSTPTLDASSATGSTVFDFDSDGRAEVIYADETHLRVFDGVNGAVLMEVANSSGTAYEYPTVVDVNNDGAAELVVSSNNYNFLLGRTAQPGINGIRVYGNAEGKWAATRSIWNQHAYNIDNINDDGTIPANPAKSWLTHNTFRLNTFPDRSPLALPDLRVGDIGFDTSTNTLTAAINNIGLAPITTSTDINFYNGDPGQGGTLLGTELVVTLASGGQTTVTLQVAVGAVTDDIVVRINELQTVEECQYQNNQSRAALINLTVQDPAALSDSQTYLLNVHNVNEAPVIVSVNQVSEMGAGGVFRYQPLAEDNDVGDVIHYSLSNAPGGASINSLTGEISWSTTASDIGESIFDVIATDLNGTTTSEEIHITIYDNTPPDIISSAVVTVSENQDYYYNVDAIDAESTTLAHQLAVSPNTMSIDPITGEITWMAGDEFLQPLMGDVAQQCLKEVAPNAVPNSTDDYINRVKDAISQGANYAMTNSRLWRENRDCMGCHVQSQTLLGLSSAKNKVEFDQTEMFALYDQFQSGLQDNGLISYSSQLYPNTENALAIWALSEWDAQESYRLRHHGLQFLLTNRVVNGGASHWESEDPVGWTNLPTGLTAIVAKSIVDLLDDEAVVDPLALSDYGVRARYPLSAGSDAPTGLSVKNGLIYIAKQNAIEVFDPAINTSQIIYQDNTTEFFDVLQIDDGSFWASGEDHIYSITPSGGLTSHDASGSFHLGIVEWNGSIYISNFHRASIFKVLPDGTLQSFAAIPSPTGLSVSDDNKLLVTTSTSKEIYAIDENGVSTVFFDGLTEIPYSITSMGNGDYLILSAAGPVAPVSLHILHPDGRHERMTTVGDSTDTPHPWRVSDVVTVNGRIFATVQGGQNELVEIETQPFISDTAPLRAVLPEIANYYLQDYLNDEDEILLSTFRMIGLAEIRKATSDPVLNAAIDNALSHLDTLLRSRQNIDGSWSENSTAQGDALITAWVGLALDYRAPLPTDPVVLSAIEYLLGTQELGANAGTNLGSWDHDNSYYPFRTRLASTSLILSYLPVGLERLQALADLSATAVAYDDNETLSATIINRGSLPVANSFTVSFYNGPVSDGDLLGSLDVAALGAQSTIDVSLTGIASSNINNNVIVVVDSADTIEECITNNNEVPAVLAEVAVVDSDNASDHQKYLINVVNTSEAPAIVSTLDNTDINVNIEFRYQVVAEDPDQGDVPSFTVSNPPAGMTINNITGVIRWFPASSQVGVHNFSVIATDLFGLSGQQSVTLTVLDTGAPVITSTPVTSAESNILYNYQVLATDPDNQLLTYSLNVAHQDMSIDNNGLISWLPTGTSSQLVTVKVTDESGFQALQTYTVHVVASGSNTSPVMELVPNVSLAPGQLFEYQVIASDPDGDPLLFELTQNPLPGLTITATGLLQWTPQPDHSGPYTFEITVSDGRLGTVAQTVTVIVSSTPNNPPQLDSNPLMQATEGQIYTDILAFSDPDGDTLHYMLVNAPTGFTVNSVTGEMNWLPSAVQIGTQTVQINVADTKGATYGLTFSIAVAKASDTVVNNPPTITSTPSFSVLPDQLYQYQVLASDSDNDSLTYTLTQAPAGMAIDTNGLLGWQPTAANLGSHSVAITVSDVHGAYSQQAYSLLVSTNRAPQFSSLPIVSVAADTAYYYNADAIDPEAQVVSYRLLEAPAGMTINSTTGELNWLPVAVDIGLHTVRIEASDTAVVAVQAFNITVTAGSAQNTPPTFTALPPTSAVADVLYQFQIAAVDAQGHNINYSLNTKPAAMTISPGGVVSWTPAQADIGPHNIVIQIDDGLAFTTLGYTLVVDSVAPPLAVDISANPAVVDPGETVTITVQASGGSGAITTSATLNGQPLSLVNGVGSYTPTTIGLYDIAATATAGTETITDTAYFSARDPNDTAAPIVVISSPTNEAIITAPVAIIGTVDDANLARYQVGIQRKTGGANQAATQQIIASSSSTVIDGVLTTLDPTLLLNGQYALIVEAIDVNGQVTSDSITLQIEGDLKVGNFSITLEDLNIPVAGIPIRVTRTYDSRRRSESLDFGYGWSVGYQDVRVEESRAPGAYWSLNTYNVGPLGLIARFCVEPQGSPIVTVTLPNGDMERFETVASPRCNDTIPVLDVDLDFIATGDTQSTLVADHSQSGRLANGHLIDLGDPNTPLDPNLYTLTTRSGYVYSLDQDFGVIQIVDPNGHTLTYADDGIHHSTGKSVLFNRDAQGRITDITDPNGQTVMSYHYDSLGDLATNTDALTAQSSYTYNSNHGLLDIIDPLGRTVVKNIYDSAGRLIAQEDSEGNRTDFNHDIAGRFSLVTDRNNHNTQFFYDDNGNILTQIDALGNSSTFSYDAQDNQLSQTDALGHTQTATYNTSNDQLTQTDALGNTTTFAYNQRGQETEITDAQGNVFTTSYDSIGNLLTVTDPQNNIAGNNINAQGLVSSTVDVLGNTTTYTYDSDGNTLTETDVEGHITTMTYDSNGNVLTETRSRTVGGNSVNDTTTFVYDARNRVIQTTDAQGNVSHSEYDLAGQQTATIDALGRRTEMDYDAYNRLIETRYADGTKETNSYDPEGNLLTAVDRVGRSTSYLYDALNRLIQTTTADGSFTQTEYDAAGRVSAEIDANGNRSEFEYDAAGRRTLTRDALGNQHTFSYDATGNLIGETDANGHTTTYQYNALYQKISTTFHNASTQQQGFDALSRRTSQTDQASITTSYAYDKLGRLLTVTDADGNTTYSYDEAGNKLTQTDAEGHTTGWTYDALSRVLTRTLPMGQLESFSYNATGNRLTQTDFNGQVTHYSYEANTDRLQLITYAGGTTEAYTYTANGQLNTVIDQHGTTTYAYDNRDRLILKTLPDGATLAYQYDSHGNRTQVSVTRGLQVTTTDYSYDVLNRLSAATDSNGITSYGYDAAGNMASVSYPNGRSQVYSYDSLNRLVSLSTYDGQGVLVEQYNYSLHSTGRRTQIDELGGRSTTYSYDTLYRLLTETITDAVNGNYSASYQYDLVGNRTHETVNGVQTQYSYDANDRLTQQGGTTYSYDNNGNTTAESLNSITTTYSYDAKNKLTAVDKGGVITAYRYNHNGIRTGKTENSLTTDYLVDENRDYAQVLIEDNGTDTVRYSYGHDLLSQDRNGIVGYYGYDGLGSVRSLTDSAGNETDRYDYEAFGEVLNETGGTVNSYRFAGEQFDEELNQVYLRNRYYNPATGTMTQMDTFQGVQSQPNSLHKYLYTPNDPVNFTDPSGRFFSLGGFGVASNLQVQLSSIQIQTSFSLLDAGLGAVGTDDAQSTQQSLRTAQNLLAIAALGAGGIAVTKILAKKFFALSAAKKFTKFKKGLFGDLKPVGARSIDKVSSPSGGVLRLSQGSINTLQNNKVYIYVVDDSDNFLLALRGSAGRSGVKHTQLTGGGSVKAAGELQVSNGQVLLNNQTGRYSAQSPAALGRVRGLLQSEGMSVTVTGPL